MNERYFAKNCTIKTKEQNNTLIKLMVAAPQRGRIYPHFQWNKITYNKNNHHTKPFNPCILAPMRKQVLGIVSKTQV